MANVSVYNMEGKEVGTMELSDAIFGVEINEHLVHMAVVQQLANNRQGTQKAKTRSEVSGGGRKPWRQKGTGRARQGSIRAVQWVGGGHAHAIQPRDYGFKINKKERVLALKSALADKLASKKVVIFDNLNLESLKTKDVKNLIEKAKLEGKVLFVTGSDCENLFMACRNLKYTYHVMAEEINVLDIVNADTLVLDSEAVKVIEEGMNHA